MEFLIGVGLAIFVGISMTVIGMDRDRALYPAIMIVIALLYVLYAVLGGSSQALVRESVFAVGFIALAVAGFRSSLWFAAAALFLHGVFDIVHPQIIDNPGVPAFWPMFCSAYDVTAAGYLAVLIYRDRIRPVTV